MAATFRLPLASLTAVFVMAVAATPVAFSTPALVAVLLVPLGLAVWVVRTRTVVAPEQLTVRRLLSTRRLPWDHVVSLRVSAKSWVRAVLADGSEITLPAVRARDLPVLAAASGGRVPAPQPPAAEEAAADQPAADAAPDRPAAGRAAAE